MKHTNGFLRYYLQVNNLRKNMHKIYTAKSPTTERGKIHDETLASNSKSWVQYLNCKIQGPKNIKNLERFLSMKYEQ